MAIANITDNILTDSGTLLSSLQPNITLTTIGSSGPATFISNTLNIPEYAGGSGGGMAIGGAITSATEGSILFAGVGGILQQDNANFFWDDTNNRLGIGTASPLAKADINGQLWVRASAGGAITGAGAGIKIEYNATPDYGNIQAYNYSTSTLKILVLNSGGGNVGIATASVGSQLQVNGNAAIGYNASTAAPTNGLAVSGNLSVGTNTATAPLTVSGTSGVMANITTSQSFAAGFLDIFQMLAANQTGGGLSFNIGKAASTKNLGKTAYIHVANGSDSNRLSWGFFDADNLLNLTAGGTLGLGTTTIGSKLQVNGNVAIGYSASTAAPTNGLQVAGNTIIGGATTSAFLQVKGSGTTSGSYQIYTTNSTASTYFFVRDDGIVGATNISAVSGTYGSGTGTQTSFNAIGGSANIQLRFTSGSTDASIFNSSGGGLKLETNSGANAIYINGTGSTGFGTTTVGSKLQINGNAAIGYSASTAAPTNGLAVAGAITSGSTTTAGGLTITKNTADGQFIIYGSSPSIRLRNDTSYAVLDIIWCGATATNDYLSGSFAGDQIMINNKSASFLMSTNAGSRGIDFKINTLGDTLVYQNLLVGTTTSGSKLQVNGNAAIGYSASTAAPTNGLAVSGNALIGTATDRGTGVLQVTSVGTVSELLTTGGDTSTYMLFSISGSTGIGSIQRNPGGGVTYNTSSDYRLKEDFKDYNALSIVNQIKTYDFKWKGNEYRNHGVIAHELQSVLSYAVTGIKDGERMQGVDYSKITPINTKAIQELHALVIEQQNKIKILESKLNIV